MAKQKYFYGNEVSQYGQENGAVDYATFAKAFQHVLNNDIMQHADDWEKISGNERYAEDSEGNFYSESEAEERIEELQEELDQLLSEKEDGYDVADDRIDEINADIESLEDIRNFDVYQYYIVSENAVDILKEADELCWYSESLDMYVWGVTHWGTSWDYVLTSIKLKED